MKRESKLTSEVKGLNTISLKQDIKILCDEYDNTKSTFQQPLINDPIAIQYIDSNPFQNPSIDTFQRYVLPYKESTETKSTPFMKGVIGEEDISSLYVLLNWRLWVKYFNINK